MTFANGQKNVAMLGLTPLPIPGEVKMETARAAAIQGPGFMVLSAKRGMFRRSRTLPNSPPQSKPGLRQPGLRGRDALGVIRTGHLFRKKTRRAMPAATKSRPKKGIRRVWV